MYLENGYLDVNRVMNKGQTLNIIIGGRGTGKTYGAIKWCIENGKRFILMRRTREQAEIISKPEFSPIIPVLQDMGIEYTINKKLGHGMAGIELNDSLFAVVIGLTGISNLRGFNANWVDIIIFDEFIGERHERPIKNEDAAFFNAYETLNRNRELTGRDPIRVMMLANANQISSVYLSALGIMPHLEKMLKKGYPEYLSRERSLYVLIMKKSPISSKKAKTALYRFTNDAFNEMALSNEFAIVGKEFICPQKSTALQPVCSWGPIYFYRIKGSRKWYVNMKKIGNFEIAYTDDKRGEDAFLLSDYYDTFEAAHLSGRVLYEDLTTLNEINVRLDHA